MVDFLHGVESIETQSGTRAIREVKTAIIGLIGTAPIHHAATPAPVGDLVLVQNDKAREQFGPRLAAYDIPEALQGNQENECGTQVVINMFDPAVHRTSVAVSTKTFAADKTFTLSPADIISATVTTAADAACVEGTDYELDRITGKLAALPGGNLIGGTTFKVAYVHANPGAVTASDIAGGVTDGIRTGIQKFLECASRFGFAPKLLIAPGFSSDPEVRAAIRAIVQKSKLRAIAFCDAPVGSTVEEILEARAAGGDVDLTDADERIVYLFPHHKVKVDGADRLVPYSARMAGVVARTDRTKGYWKSPSNEPIVGITGVELALTASVNDPQCETNQVNAVGVSTVFAAFGVSPRTWGNRSSVFPGVGGIMSFVACRRTADVVEESIELASLKYLDEVYGDVFVTAVLDDVNAFIRKLISRGALMPGSGCAYIADDNPSEEIAEGRLTFTTTFCPPPPVERITFKTIIDTTLLTQRG